MPNRFDNPAGPDLPRGPRREPGDNRSGGRPEGRAFSDPAFRAGDARLQADMERYRSRYGPARVEYGHDQTYRPGYHEGGVRFGFFGGPHDDDHRPQIDREFDPDYVSWRDQQLSKHDRDYADWRHEQARKYDDDYWKFRSERREDFHQRFQDWLAQRQAAETKVEEPKKD